MNIAVIGAGAMGELFGALLSERHEVTLWDVNEARVRFIDKNGVRVHEPDGQTRLYHPKAALCAEANTPAELVLLFVKATASHAALQGCRALLNSETTLLTLQNGMGHDAILREFLPEQQIALGVTQHNSSLVSEGEIRHGGIGHTVIGSPSACCAPRADIERIAKAFTECGIETKAVSDIRPAIWEKLLMNASSSAMTGVLQARQGLCIESDSARALLQTLIREAVAVAAAEGVSMNADIEISKIEERLRGARLGLPSIAADIRDGRLTEAGTITGAVVEAARRNNIPAPAHEIMLMLLRALEDRARMPELSDI